MSGTVLVIGGSDSSGGAGITRDVATLSAFGVPAAVAITAVTAQTDTCVTAIHHVPPAVIAEQVTTALTSRTITAIKIGMLGSTASLQAVAAALARTPLSRTHCHLVLDPVLVSSSGTLLLEGAALSALHTLLLPHVTLLTPNIPEAAALLQTPPAVDESALLRQARALLELGPQAVLMKGGHGSGPTAMDLLVSRDSRVERLSAPRLPTSLRGTGCRLASAIAAGLVLQQPLLEACSQAKRYVTEQLERSLVVA
jgi:hydroxymethylpyrimidine/phosphomethylpyrimidine kinase